MAYAINPYSGKQLPARPAGGPVNPAPGPGGGIGGGGQQGLPGQTGGMFGTGGGYMGMPQGPIPSGLAAFKDPRVLMMLSGVASGASQGRNPLSGAIQGGFGAVGSLADMEQQAQRNKMTQREMEFAENQEERRQREFKAEQDAVQQKRDKEQAAREREQKMRRDMMQFFAQNPDANAMDFTQQMLRSGAPVKDVLSFAETMMAKGPRQQSRYRGGQVEQVETDPFTGQQRTVGQGPRFAPKRQGLTTSQQANNQRIMQARKAVEPYLNDPAAASIASTDPQFGNLMRWASTPLTGQPDPDVQKFMTSPMMRQLTSPGQGGQAGGSARAGGPSPQQVPQQQRGGQRFKSEADVNAAYQAGQLTYEQASRILRERFGAE